MVQDQMYSVVENIRTETNIQHVIVTSFHDFLPEQPELPLHSMMEHEKQVFSNTFELFDLINGYKPNPPNTDVSLSDFGWLLYTGGTTGLPKGCIHTNYNAVASAVGGGYSYGGIINSFKYDGPELIAAFPVTHISGLLLFCYISVWGGCGIMLARMEPAQILEAVDRYNPDTLIAPLLIFHAIIENYSKFSQAKDYDLSSLTSCLCSSHGGPWNREHAKKWFDLTGTYIYSWGYSGTEYFNYPAAGTFLNRLEEMAYGKPGPGFRVRIEDLETREIVQDGERGEIVAKCATLFEGYWDNPKKTEETLINGWFRSGDLGSLGSDETLYFFGKSTEAFPVSGYMVSPDEVSTIGLNHPDIAEIAVIPIPNPDRPEDNVAKAFVVLHQQSSATQEDLIEWFKKNIAKYKCPRKIEICSSLPKSVKGEILKRELIKKEKA
jgi:long-chain acyl-CoA synthetase